MGSVICKFQRSLVRNRVYRDRDGGRGREGEEIKIRCAGRYFSVWVYNLLYNKHFILLYERK